MSEEARIGTPEFRRQLDEFLDRMTTERLRAMTPDELTAIMREYSDFLKKAEIPRPPLGWELEAFASSLAIRQGTLLTDFESIYRRKAELDDRLLGEGLDGPNL